MYEEIVSGGRDHHLFEDAPAGWLEEQSDEDLAAFVSIYERQQREKRPRHLSVVRDSEGEPV